jgi:translocation and assembly module TamB
LRVLQSPGKDLLGDGDLAIIDGTYRLSSGMKLTAAIGKPLTIEQGLLVFAKTPLSNPGLVLTAKREGGDVTAGVRVFGTLKNPKLTFFSDTDPGLSQAEVSNYLLTGVPPRGSSGDEQDRSLSVGTYVAPKLFVEYDYSLGDEPDKVKLRYDLNNWVELQTETGENQGADVFFKFER